MAKRMLIDALHPEETRVVIADENQIYDLDFVSATKKQLKGNIYLAKITRVEPSLQAAFVEYGGGKQGFLPFAEIHPDYYQIPVSDRKRLMQEAERAEPQDDDEAAAEQQAAPAEESATTETAPSESMTENDDHPAYLREGAIDVSASEEAPLPEQEQEQEQEPEAPQAADEATEPQSPAETGDTPGEEAPAAAEGKGEEPAESVETIENEEEEIRQNRQKKTFSRRYKIQEVIRRGQVVLVQVIKEERGNKGVSLTTYLSLAGRYCVLMPNSPKDGGISRKIASAEDRKRLKAISAELRLAEGISVIIRTAGMDRTRAEIKRDYDYLVKVWNHIREDTLKSNAPALIYEESDIIKRAIRDQYANDILEVLVEGDDGYKAAKEFMKLLLPSHTPRVKQYKEPTPLFYAYNIEDQLLSMHDPVVKLRSGGYIVINPTEALISIDVNSGRSTGERNIEETATKTNLEAAAEVARQLRLRDLAGLIVIDFIDMLESRNRRAVEKALKDALKMDRAKIQLGRISPFGLLEMSRQRLRPSISETNMVQCPHCVGRGYIRSNDSMSIQMIRALEKEASTGNWGVVRLIAPQAVALHLLNTKRHVLRTIEERYNVSIQVTIDGDLATSDYSLEKMRRPQSDRGGRNERGGRNDRNDRGPRSAPPSMETAPEEPAEEMAEEAETSGREPQEATGAERPRRERGGRRRGRRGGRNRRDGAPPSSSDLASNDNVIDMPREVSEITLAPEELGEQAPPRRERGGRGRRRWKDGDEKDAPRDRRPPREEGKREEEAPRLPAFATEEPVPVAPPPRPYRSEAMAAAAPVLESTPRDPNAAPKKGWWKKMIELDD